MTSALIDSNAILRYLTNDVVEQAGKVENYLLKAEKGEIKLEVRTEVIIEVIFHLVNWYKLPKAEACDKIIAFISPDWMNVPSKSAALEALQLYRTKNIDFVDLLLWSIAKVDGKKILSFDKDFDKLQPTLRLPL